MSGRKNSIDGHPRKKEIVEAILKGDSFRNITKQYSTEEDSFSFDAVFRYAHANLKKDIAVYLSEQHQSENLTSIDGCVKELEEIAAICKRMVKKAEEDLAQLEEIGVPGPGKKDVYNYLRGYLNELRSTVETIGKFLGMVKDVNVVNNISIPTSQFIANIITILEDELSDQPEVLKRIEDRLNG